MFTNIRLMCNIPSFSSEADSCTRIHDTSESNKQQTKWISVWNPVHYHLHRQHKSNQYGFLHKQVIMVIAHAGWPESTRQTQSWDLTRDFIPTDACWQEASDNISGSCRHRLLCTLQCAMLLHAGAHLRSGPGGLGAHGVWTEYSLPPRQTW